MEMVDKQFHETIVKEIDSLMVKFSHTKIDTGYGYRWRFENGMWFDVIDYKKKSIQILRVSRGARLVKQYPILHNYFDIVSKVIAKMEIPTVSVLEEKNMAGLFKLLDEAPRGVRVI